ncbi:MAG: pyocin knob domain-containing protein [Limimaricola soesokkakensis]|uniref:pyocin knob domain-containing protein n=1 Tax=Limimaricola soesokkakensis TaxID=1343159 RepID=UPI0040581C54
MVLTLDPAPNAPSYSNPDTFEPDTSNYLAWMKVIRDQLSGIALEKGDFGLGANAVLIGNASVVDASIVTGFYIYDTSAGSSGGPDNVSRGALIHSRRTSAGGESQLLVVETGTGVESGRTFARSRVAGSWSTWKETLITSDKVASNTDVTAGRLLTPGYMGLGGSASIGVTDLNTINANGFYKISSASAGTGNAPTGSGNWEVFHNQFDGNAGSQLAFQAGGNTAGAPIYWRTRGSGIWAPWTRLEAYGGSNPNGRYVRFPDGTQICYHVLSFTDIATATGNLFTTNGEITWNFPAGFSTTNGLNVDASVRFGTAWGTGRTANLSSGLFRGFHPTSITGSFDAELRAFGYYK